MTELGEIPKEWKVKKLGDIAIGKGEYGIGASATEYIEGKSRYLRITDIGDSCKLLFNDIKGLDDNNYEKYILKEGDIVLARTGNTTGKGYVYNKEDGELVYAGFLIKYSINNNIAKHNFIKYIIQSKRYWNWVNIMSTRSGQPGINSTEYSNFIIQLPSLEEQEKIASILSTVDEEIDNVDALIEKNKELKKGLMQTLLTKGIGHTKFKKTEIGEIPEEWKLKTFKDISKVSQGLQIAIDERYKEFKAGRLPYITIQYLNDKLNPDNEYFIENFSQNVVCKEDDILMTRTGNTGIVVTNEVGVFHNNFFKVDFRRDLFNKDFLVFFLNAKFIQSLIIRYAGTTTIPDLKHSDFYKLPIVIPLLEEQEKIASILSEVDKKIEGYENKKKKLEELKKGLMQQLLTGKMRVV